MNTTEIKQMLGYCKKAPLVECKPEGYKMCLNCVHRVPHTPRPGCMLMPKRARVSQLGLCLGWEWNEAVLESAGIWNGREFIRIKNK